LVDVYDGKHLWLKNDENDIHQKYYYGEDPPGTDDSGSALNKEKVRIVNEGMTGVPTEQTDLTKNTKTFAIKIRTWKTTIFIGTLSVLYSQSNDRELNLVKNF
jgi:hypothetical protein